jgi:hypothetical protein
MSTPLPDLFADVDLPDDADAPAVWDAAVTALRDGLTGQRFGGAGTPALLLASVPEPLFRAWADRRGVEPEPTADGVPGFALDPTVHVAAQTESDRRFLGRAVLYVMAVDGDGAWCPRGVSMPVAEVVRRHLRTTPPARRAA